MKRIDYGQKPYRSLNQELLSSYGSKYQKIALNGGMTCPNRDGTLGSGGCIFCSEGGSGEYACDVNLSITEQIESGIQQYHSAKNTRREDDPGFIAYFQSFTNTYADVAYLRKIFTEAISHPSVAILSIGTRPDCLPQEVLDLLAELNTVKPVWVELGLQTIHEKTAQLIRRGYELPVFEKAFIELKRRGIYVIVHVILGLPFESCDDMYETIRYLSGFPVDGIKLQLMHVLKNTDLAKMDFPLFSMEEYIDVLIHCIELLHPSITIHRITGDGPKELLIAPLWSLNKRKVLNAVHHEFKIRNTWQGRLYEEKEEHR